MRGGAIKIPPLVEGDAVAVSVSAGADGGVAGRGHRVGVVVVAVGEVRAAVEEEIEAVGLREVCAIALEEVSAELVDDELDNQLGVGGVDLGVGEGGEEG